MPHHFVHISKDFQILFLRNPSQNSRPHPDIAYLNAMWHQEEDPLQLLGLDSGGAPWGHSDTWEVLSVASNLDRESVGPTKPSWKFVCGWHNWHWRGCTWQNPKRHPTSDNIHQPSSISGHFKFTIKWFTSERVGHLLSQKILPHMAGAELQDHLLEQQEQLQMLQETRSTTGSKHVNWAFLDRSVCLGFFVAGSLWETLLLSEQSNDFKQDIGSWVQINIFAWPAVGGPISWNAAGRRAEDLEESQTRFDRSGVVVPYMSIFIF